ncbi:MAG: hydrolase [Pseudomonadota bacterium]
MKTNAVPAYDVSDNPTGCCPKFQPEVWDGQTLHFENKRFVRVKTRSVDHVPMDIDPVFQHTFKEIQKAHADDPDDVIVLSRDVSDVEGEHFFAVSKDVPNLENVRLSGDYVTRVFEGPYENAPLWEQDFKAFLKQQNHAVDRIYYFYTTCPKCADVYGKNYVVAVAKLAD